MQGRKTFRRGQKMTTTCNELSSPAELLQHIRKQSILVVGDLILDQYIYGKTERTSPEAPVPVVLYERERVVAGGAANVARNAACFGCRVSCIGVIGEDRGGEQLLSLLKEDGIHCESIIRVPGRPTTIKTRIISQNQQILRLDREVTQPLPGSLEDRLCETVGRALHDFGAIVVSDYAKGLLSDRLLGELFAHASQSNKPVFVDPKARDYRRYRGAFAITPNAREAAEASGIATDSEEGTLRAAAAIREVTGCQYVIITRGPKGVAVVGPDNSPLFVPTRAREVFDVTGAGDTFIAFLAMSIAAGLPIETAAQLANAAAGIVVGKVGAATVSFEELLSTLQPETVNKKLVSPTDLHELGERLRASRKRIVFTNGCFDFLHAGHVALLQEAKRFGDVLVVAVNTDNMITKIKGAPRPILKLPDRLRLLSAIEAVDYIVPFDEETPHTLLSELRPDVLVKGRNYTLDQVEGREVVESYGGSVVLLETMEAFSTKALIDRHTHPQKS